MKNQSYKWGRFFCKLFKRAYRLEMTPEQKGMYISDVVKAYMMGIECGYENRRKEETECPIKADS